jgi:hypothetical protein
VKKEIFCHKYTPFSGKITTFQDDYDYDYLVFFVPHLDFAFSLVAV